MDRKYQSWLECEGSGSSGNCYCLCIRNLITGKDERILLECGLKYTYINHLINYKPSSVMACLVSHHHKDHSIAINDVLKRNIEVYMSKEEYLACDNVKPNYNVKYVEAEEKYRIGDFTIMPISVEHDSPNPMGFVIHHDAIGNLLYATDTYYLKYKFNFPINHIMIECNYQTELLKKNFEEGRINEERYNRTFKSHLSLEQCIKTIKSFDLPQVRTIMLIHLSNDNTNEGECLTELTNMLSNENTHRLKLLIARKNTKYAL